ncbi:MAG: hypothetical protein CMB16_06770 [Euryarchaeota archaeon]|nr:hypothetical protein [Euryarchaeota archaeon]
MQDLSSNTLVQSFLFFSIFRAIYGTIILIVTWLLATESDGPWWWSIVFLAFSMVFSRILFRWIKSLRGKKEEEAPTSA